MSIRVFNAVSILTLHTTNEQEKSGRLVFRCFGLFSLIIYMMNLVHHSVVCFHVLLNLRCVGGARSLNK